MHCSAAAFSLFLSTIVLPPCAHAVETVSLLGNTTFPEGILRLDDESVLVGGFGDGSLQIVNLVSGTSEYLNPPGENGMVIAVGFDLNEDTGELWVANFNFAIPGVGVPGSQFKVFDVANGTLKATIPEDFVPGIFLNEVVVDPNTGKVYATDTFNPYIWTLGPSLNDTLQVFANDTLLSNPAPNQPFDLNGLAITPDGKYLVASVMDRLDAGDGTLYKIDIVTQQVQEITLTDDSDGMAVAAFAGSDGMFFFENALYMVNVFSLAGAIFTADFDDDYDVATLAIRDITTYNRPTASAVVNGKLWTVNSQLDHIIDDGNGAVNTPPDLPFTISGVPLADLTTMTTVEPSAAPPTDNRSTMEPSAALETDSPTSAAVGFSWPPTILSFVVVVVLVPLSIDAAGL